MTATKQFLTIYRQDYIPLGAKRPEIVKVDQLPTHTIDEDYEFNSIRHEIPPPRPSAIDLANEYLEETFKKEQPKIYKIYFKEPVLKSEIEPELKANSLYERHYCAFFKGPKDDTIQIATSALDSIETEMKDAYRPPDRYRKITPTYPILQPSSHTKNQQLIAKTVKTLNESEYEGNINKTGKVIIDHELFGKMVYPSDDK